jgi:hypothetical protein
MGRSTPSFRMAVYRELKRIERITRLMKPSEKGFIEWLIDGIDDTISLYTHVSAPLDPLEVILIHVIRRLSELGDGARGRVDPGCEAGREECEAHHGRKGWPDNSGGNTAHL